MSFGWPLQAIRLKHWEMFELDELCFAEQARNEMGEISPDESFECS